jgi:hypothetical protein
MSWASSTIIQDIESMRKAELASSAYFYFDFRDAEKQTRHNFLSSLLVQICDRSASFCSILSDLYSKHRNGSQQPSYAALIQCLKTILGLPGQETIYIIADALDECPNNRGLPSPREKVLGLIKELIDLRHPKLRICITSRPEIDIRNFLDPLASQKVSLHEERGQKQDIADYIKSVVHSDSKMRRWRAEDKELVIRTLSDRADGM